MKLPGPLHRPLPQSPTAPGHCTPSREVSLLSLALLLGGRFCQTLNSSEVFSSCLARTSHFRSGISLLIVYWVSTLYIFRRDSPGLHLSGVIRVIVVTPWQATVCAQPLSRTANAWDLKGPRGPHVRSLILHVGNPRPRTGAWIHRAVVSPVDRTWYCPLPHPAPHLAGGRTGEEQKES